MWQPLNHPVGIRCLSPAQVQTQWDSHAYTGSYERDSVFRNRPIGHHGSVQCQPSPPPLTATLLFRDPSRLDQCQFRQRMNITAPRDRHGSLSRRNDDNNDNDDIDDGDGLLSLMIAHANETTNCRDFTRRTLHLRRSVVTWISFLSLNSIRRFLPVCVYEVTFFLKKVICFLTRECSAQRSIALYIIGTIFLYDNEFNNHHVFFKKKYKKVIKFYLNHRFIN